MTSDPGSTPHTTPPGPGGDGAATIDRTQRIDALAAYFRTNRDAFTQEALRKTASEAGYEPRDIDAAWAVSAVPVSARGKGSLITVLGTIAYLVASYGLAGVLLASAETTNLALPVLGLALVFGIFAWLMLRDSRPALASAFKYGVIIAVVAPVVISLVVIGLCFVLVAGVGVGR